MSAAHRVLVADDDPIVAAVVADFVRARGDSPRVVHTVVDALAAIAEEHFCYAIVDQQLPWDAAARPMLSGGEAVMRALREKDDRRVDNRWHVLPILALTGYSADPGFVDAMRDLGADAFVAKPLDPPALETLGARIRTLLERARRSSHEACAPAPAVRIRIDGKKDGARNAVEINGERRELPDRWFVVLLRFVAAHVRAPGAFSTRDELGIVKARDATHHVRAAFAGLVPEGFEVIQGDRTKRFRLNPEIAVEHVAWPALLAHPDPQVAKLARQMSAS